MKDGYEKCNIMQYHIHIHDSSGYGFIILVTTFGSLLYMQELKLETYKYVIEKNIINNKKHML